MVRDLATGSERTVDSTTGFTVVEGLSWSSDDTELAMSGVFKSGAGGTSPEALTRCPVRCADPGPRRAGLGYESSIRRLAHLALCRYRHVDGRTVPGLGNRPGRCREQPGRRLPAGAHHGAVGRSDDGADDEGGVLSLPCRPRHLRSSRRPGGVRAGGATAECLQRTRTDDDHHLVVGPGLCHLGLVVSLAEPSSSSLDTTSTRGQTARRAAWPPRSWPPPSWTRPPDSETS